MPPPPLLCAIAAVSADGFISKGTGVPWDLEADRQHFRRATQGKWLLLGRRTFDEMQGWFTDHHPLVLTRSRDFQPSVGQAVATVAEALKTAERHCATELWVCGGAATYAEAWPQVQRAIITQVADELGDGLPFPPISGEEWTLLDRHSLPRHTAAEPVAEVITYQRISHSS
ncbi:MAG: dihydrofolate reductase, partial [Verrucomicrobiales bacterium]|nr:dihydrofolate reductase [Verrucomicrobiales bacterium]